MSDPTAAPNSAADSSDRSPISVEPIAELIRLGEQLRQAREAQGLGIEELAGRLHIGNDQLLALERGDRTHLPEAVFVIAQARRVASVLAIDVEETIARLRQCRLMQTSGHRSAAPPPASSGGGSAGVSTGGSRSQAAPPGSDPMPRPLSRPPGRPTLTERLPLLPLLPLLAGLAALAAAFGMVRALRQPPVRSPLPPSLPAPAPTVRTSPQASVLVLRATEPSWLEVRTLAGERQFEGTLQGERRFPLGSGLEVRAGRPYAVMAGVGDQPSRPLGKVDEIAWQRFLPPKPVPPAAVPPARTPPAPAP